MTKLAPVLMIVAATGCGTLFNKKTINLDTDPGVSIEGGTSSVSQHESHVVSYGDGRTCSLHSGISAGYFILDLFTTGPIGLIIDGVTGNWRVLKGDCPGVHAAD